MRTKRVKIKSNPRWVKEVIEKFLKPRLERVEKEIFVGLAGEFTWRDNLLVYHIYVSENKEEILKELSQFGGCDTVILRGKIIRNKRGRVSLVAKEVKDERT
jgi:hypothetical protein